jgi:hypothetical protein
MREVFIIAWKQKYRYGIFRNNISIGVPLWIRVYNGRNM